MDIAALIPIYDKMRIAERLVGNGVFIVPMFFGMRVCGIVGPKQPKTKSITPPAVGGRTPDCLIGIP
jgi:hypothetical protein